MIERTAERRQRRLSLVLPERRSGFDRRNQAAVRVLRDNPSLLLGVLVALNALNVLDWSFTRYEMSAGAIEGNPVMAALFGFDSAAAGVFKVTLMLVVSFVIWRGRRYRRVLELAVIAAMMYAALLAYHLFAIAVVLPRM